MIGMAGGESRSLALDVFLLVLANVIWGGTDVAAKFALESLSPAGLLELRLSIALLAFLPVLWFRRREIPRGAFGLWPFLVLGACGFFLDFLLVYHGLKLAPASHATALRITEVLAIVVLSGLILREKVSRRAGLGLCLGMAGVVLVLNIDFRRLGLFATGARLGDLLIIAGITVEALYTVLGKRVLKRQSPLTTIALAVLFAWLLMSVFFGVRVAREFISRPPSSGSLLACVYLGLVALALANYIYYRVLSRRHSHQVAVSIMLQPLVGIPLARLIFHEPLTPKFLTGAALIAAGVYAALMIKERG